MQMCRSFRPMEELGSTLQSNNNSRGMRLSSLYQLSSKSTVK